MKTWHFPAEPPPRARVLDAVEVTLEAEPVRVGLLGTEPVARADGPGGAGGELVGEPGLPLLAAEQPGADERVDALVRRTDDDVVDGNRPPPPSAPHSHSDRTNGV